VILFFGVRLADWATFYPPHPTQFIHVYTLGHCRDPFVSVDVVGMWGACGQERACAFHAAGWFIVANGPLGKSLACGGLYGLLRQQMMFPQTVSG
jgi:hypothetical protein